MCWAGVGLSAQQTHCLSCGRANWCVWLCGPLTVMARPGLGAGSALGSFLIHRRHSPPQALCQVQGEHLGPRLPVTDLRPPLGSLPLGSSCFGDGSLQPSGHLAPP